MQLETVGKEVIFESYKVLDFTFKPYHSTYMQRDSIEAKHIRYR